MPNLVNLKSRVFNQPLLLESGYAQVLFGALTDKLGIEELTFGKNKLNSDELKTLAAGWGGERTERKPYAIKNGTALIDIDGSLVAKSSYLDAMSGITGYDKIKSDLDTAFADDDVSNITLNMSSSGGEVTGCFELADYMYSKRGGKKMTALVGSRACSACYMLASACDEILASETAIIGSVGVITAHTSVAAAMEKQGVKITLITAGKHKADGNPYQDLPKEVFDKMSTDMGEIRMMFATRVAKFRGMSVDTVLSTEAATYLGSNAIDVGLADGIVSPLEYLEQLSHSGGNNLINMESQMTKPVVDNVEVIAKADHDAAVAEATADGVKQGQTEMQTRVKEILMCDEAAGKTKMAHHLAFNTSMNAEESKGMLAVSGAEVVAAAPVTAAAEPVVAPVTAAAASFTAQMEVEQTEEVGTDTVAGATGLNADANSAEFALAAAKVVNG